MTSATGFVPGNPGRWCSERLTVGKMQSERLSVHGQIKQQRASSALQCIGVKPEKLKVNNVFLDLKQQCLEKNLTTTS